jgi:hypothetical protein
VSQVGSAFAENVFDHDDAGGNALGWTPGNPTTCSDPDPLGSCCVSGPLGGETCRFDITDNNVLSSSQISIQGSSNCALSTSSNAISLHHFKVNCGNPSSGQTLQYTTTNYAQITN